MDLPRNGTIRLYRTADSLCTYFFGSEARTPRLVYGDRSLEGTPGCPHGSRAPQQRKGVHEGEARGARRTKQSSERPEKPKNEKASSSSGSGAKGRMSLSQRINEYFNRQSWREARQLLFRAIKRHPDDHWLLSRLSTTYYEERDYLKALETSRRAAKLDSTCPLVLWDLAGALDAVGDKEQAIKIYEKLISRRIDGVANDECGEGEEWAASLLADCKARTALCYMDEYLADIRSGIKSIYVLLCRFLA